jgi:hypothetical protein
MIFMIIHYLSTLWQVRIIILSFMNCEVIEWEHKLLIYHGPTAPWTIAFCDTAKHNRWLRSKGFVS